MTLKDNNYLKNVYLLSIVNSCNIKSIIERFDSLTSDKPKFKREVVLLMDGKDSVNETWNRLLSPVNFSKELKTVLDRLKENTRL